MWYKRHECGLRMAIFFSAATAAGAFGGLLARGIMGMNGVGGKTGWAWIFIIEGIVTIIIGVFPVCPARKSKLHRSPADTPFSCLRVLCYARLPSHGKVPHNL
jgi:MFS family permease